MGAERLEALRTQHQVRPVSGEEDGNGFERLPGGVYGFTYAPMQANRPLFSKKTRQSFEIHKLAGGEAVIVGFLPEDTAARVEAGGEALEIRLFPDPDQDAVRPVSVPLSRVVRSREASLREIGALDLVLG